MTELEIKKYPDPILSKKAQAVKKVNKEIKQLIKDMLETMQTNNGVGLAAPQVGSLHAVIVAAAEGRALALVNPKITKKEGTDIAEEGCLSFPWLCVPVKRATKITIEGLNEKGKKVTLKEEGLMARILQHETDHLNGVTIIDHASPDELKEILATLELSQQKPYQDVLERCKEL